MYQLRDVQVATAEEGRHPMQKQKDGLKGFQELLEKKGHKMTYERRHIYDEVMSLKDHFDADSLYERFKKKGMRIARGTVYRTIPFLLESGVIQKAAGEGKRDFYERTSRKGHHDHMICVQCGKIIEFFSKAIERDQAEACGRYNFKMTFHDHRIFGYCKDCQ